MREKERVSAATAKDLIQNNEEKPQYIESEAHK